MKYILFLFLLIISTQAQSQSGTSVDTVYPIKVKINNQEMTCFKPDQARRIAETINDLENCKKEAVYNDSTEASLLRELLLQQGIVNNDNSMIQALNKKNALYESIIKEKDVQLQLKDREKIVAELKSDKKNYALEILVFLTGGLIGYALHK